MRMTRLRRSLALIMSAALLASLTAATVAAPTSAAKPKCFGKTATIVGTDKGERIVGTNKRDVIVAKGGNDRIFGRGGNDLICGGNGIDRLVGGPGIDKLLGQNGPDRLFGGPGPDRLFPGVGNDLVSGGPGNDVIDGGPGTDTCYQNLGSGPVVRCELPAAPVAPPPDTGPTLIDLDAMDILAVAYSDIDGLDGYSTRDVMIAKIVDENGDGIVSPNDLIKMGRYPTNLDATAFEDWLVKTHTVKIVTEANDKFVFVRSASGENHRWWFHDGEDRFDGYNEQDAVDFGLVTSFSDYWSTTFPDDLAVNTGTDSQPRVAVPFITAPNTGAVDRRFVDVVLNY